MQESRPGMPGRAMTCNPAGMMRAVVLTLAVHAAFFCLLAGIQSKHSLPPHGDKMLWIVPAAAPVLAAEQGKPAEAATPFRGRDARRPAATCR